MPGKKPRKRIVIPKKANDPEENKMNDNDVSHRWIDMTLKRGDQTVIPSKF